MPVAPALQTLVPLAYQDSFTDGELSLAVASPASATPGRSTYHLSRWFTLDGGVYAFKCYAKDSARFYVGPTSGNAKFLFSQIDAQGVVTSIAYLPPGRQMLTVVLSNVQPTAASTLVAFSISKGGRTLYTSSASGWVFDTVQIADGDVPITGDSRLALRVFNFRPNWAGGITERISFSTEILTSETDAEQRRSMRRYPRRSFEASFLRTERDRARLQSFLTGAGREFFLVPLWHEQFTLQTTFGSPLQLPIGSAANREFQPGTLALLSSKDTTNHEVVLVDAVYEQTDEITLTRLQPAQSWPVGSRLTPLRVARITDTTQIENPTDSVGFTTLRFELRDPDTHVTPDWRYCVPLWQFPFNWATPVNVDFNRLSFDLDNGSSLPESVSPGERTRLGVRAGLTLRGRSQVYGLRQFIASARGRQTSFWFPTELNDLQPVGDIGGLYFDVEDSGIAEFVNTPQEIHRQIVIRFKGEDRPPIFREITLVEQLVSVERVFVAIALPSISLAQIERISLVLPVRFEQDSFELQHLVDDCAAIATNVIVRSTDVGDLPPIECVVTSQLYPLEVIESLNVSMTVTSVNEPGFIYPPEAIEPSLTANSVSVQTILRTIETYPAEAINVTTTVNSLTIDAGPGVVAVTSWPAEAINTTMTVSAVNVQAILVTYVNWPAEAVDVSMTVASMEILT